MANPFPCLLWYWQNDFLLSRTSQKPDERESDEDEEGFGGILGNILPWCCTGILITCLVCSACAGVRYLVLCFVLTSAGS